MARKRYEEHELTPMANGNTDLEGHAVTTAMHRLTEALKSPPTVNQPLLLALISGLSEKIELLIGAQKDGVKIAMDAADKAVLKAEEAANKRFDGLNELRSMAADWRTEFARQGTVDLQVNGLDARLRAAEGSLRERDSRGIGRGEVIVWTIGGLMAGASLTAILTFAFHFTH